MSRKNFSCSRGARTRASGIALACGARTRACRVHTPVNAKIRISTRPRIILNPRNQTRLPWIPLDIPSNTIPLSLIPHPMIVRFALPELLAGPVQQSIRLARRRTLQRFQKMGRCYQGLQKDVNVVRHDCEGPQLVVAEINSSMQRVQDDLRDAGLPQILRTGPGGVEAAVNPSEGFSRCGGVVAGLSLGRRRVPAGRETSVQRPSYEQPAAFGIRVGKTAARVHESLVALCVIKSRVHMSVNVARRSACGTSSEACATSREVRATSREVSV